MTKLLEQAFDAARRLSEASQDEIARAVLHLSESSEPEPVDPADLAAVLEGLAQATRREFSSDAEIEAAFRADDHSIPRGRASAAD
ncbi:MAG TPA: hypothetical protein VHY35_22125 [Stellaceae bacterium]|jgi:hypothetical protein|nr:hypothetical protein [Stellaceae bacterium]